MPECTLPESSVAADIIAVIQEPLADAPAAVDAVDAPKDATEAVAASSEGPVDKEMREPQEAAAATDPAGGDASLDAAMDEAQALSKKRSLYDEAEVSAAKALEAAVE
jgi:hypothetical protein